ncbi:methyltransferase [Maribacter sp. MMG018]|uniref:tRNA1(Val) (adenine(37)-N6)-methyltransferase n=1 Tax=Maribacter sp. MMG018 TaxID=2822688 RepID=UPI001B368156|nr:methyltransferase [Maribacter sp. MMG018]MBQ4913870.1 methyltransferase [Maribacter sp. MMG018]
MKPFTFKQFNVAQDRCAMKIGTDGVLLGAWAPVNNEPVTILDIGSGTGVIALMLAQRSNAEIIDAIEVDGDAYEQSVENFEASPWGDRLYCYHAGLDEFVDEIEDRYDLIVSNPPFYVENVDSGSESRDLARQNSALPFDELLEGVAKLLSEKGRFATIIPYKEEAQFITMASDLGLYPKRVTRVRGNEEAPIKRSLMEFSREATELSYNELTIEKARHVYTDEYVHLTKDFYLKM